jgi:hypothetical protein
MSRHPKSGKVYGFINPKTGEMFDDSQAVIERLTACPLPRVRLYPSVRYRREAVLPDATGLVELARQHTELRHLGRDRYQARCPLHRPDRHPSFTIIGGYWRCWANCCGEGPATAGQTPCAHASERKAYCRDNTWAGIALAPFLWGDNKHTPSLSRCPCLTHG